MVKVYALSIEDTVSNDVYEQFIKLIPKCKLETISRKRFNNDKKRSLYADILIRYLICKNYDICNDKIKFYNNDYGKPYLFNKLNCYFNISHSGKWIFVGLSNNEIGVDIEQITNCDLDIAKHFFTTQEYHDLLNAKDQNQLFFEIWSIKESYIKYKGLGLSINLDSFNCRKLTDSIAVILNEDRKLNVRLYNLDKNYSSVVCSIEESASTVQIVTLKQIYEYFT